MKLSILTWLAPPAVLATVLALPSAAPAPAPAPESWSIDSVHSSVVFKVRHMGVSNFYGMFKELGGQISLDPDDVSRSSVTFTIQAASVDSRSSKRDQHLSSPDFFSVKEFPTIEFKSTSVKAAGKDEFEVAGKLTLHGVTKDLTLRVHQVGMAEGQQGNVAGFETQTTIKRSDFGMDYGLEKGALGDEVEVTVAIEARVEYCVPVTPVDVLLGVVFPAVVAALFLLLVKRQPTASGAGAALAVGGAYVLAHMIQRGWRGFPPAEATDWPWLGAVTGAVLGAAPVGSGAVVARLALAWAATTLLVIAWSRGDEPTATLPLLGLLGMFSFLAWKWLAARASVPAAARPTLLALTAAGAAAALGLSGSLKLAILAAALAAVLTAVALVSALRLAPAELDGLIAPFVLTTALLLAVGCSYSYLPWWSAVLIALSPCATWLLASALGVRASRPLALVGLALLALAPLAWAIHLAVDASPSWDS